MLLSRKIGAVFRGKATPRQVMFATVLGGLLGFVPGFFLRGDLGGGFAQSPGLLLLLTCLVLVLNANLAVFGLITLLAKLLSFVLLPVAYAIGVFLLDGPTRGLFEALVNGKVTAWFGLEYYATTGGLVLGLAFGVLAGLVLNKSIRTVRQRMANVEAGSEAYKKHSKKWWVKLLVFLFLGKGKGKQTWRELSESTKKGLPVRLVGVIAAAVLVGGVVVFQSFFSTPILTEKLQLGLESANGATVDLKEARLGLADGRLHFSQLAISDAKDLGKNVFAAEALVATIDTGELLRKRLVIDELRATNATTGSTRTRPGVLRPAEPKPEPPPAPAGQKTAEDWLKDFDQYRERFEQVRDWIERLTGGDAEKKEPTPKQIEEQRKRQEAAGLAKVQATHLLSEAPRVLIRKIDIEGIGCSWRGQQDKLDLRARFLSDAPSLVDEALSFTVQSQGDWLDFGLTGGSKTQRGLGLKFALSNLAVDSVFSQLKIGGTPPVRGGTMALSLDGTLGQQDGELALAMPLQVRMDGATFALGGLKPTLVESLVLPVGLRGPLVRPSVSLDDTTLRDALLRAGKQELANFVQGQAGKLLGGLPPEVSGLIDPNKPPEQMLEDAQQKLADEKARLEAEAKAKLEAEQKRLEEEAKKKAADEAKKRLRGILPGGGNPPGGGGQ
jgi:uncharacterized protein (TIGR03546 family)